MSSQKEENKFKYKLSHMFHNSFIEVAQAFWRKYRENNGYSLITIASVRQENDHSFTFVRRIDNVLSSTPTFERITYDNLKPSIVADLYDNSKVPNIAERCIYQMHKLGTDYILQVYKEQINSFIRRKLFQWGVETMEKTILACKGKA